MRMLFVEDDENFLGGVKPVLDRALPDAEIIVSKSRDSAIDRIRREAFDFFLLDLKLPSADAGLDLDVEHGRAVFHVVRECAPRTPILFLTGSNADDVADDLVRHAEQVDVWGDGPVATIQILRKASLDKAIESIRLMGDRVRATEQIEIRAPGLDLDRDQKRVLRIFARRRGGASCVVKVLSGGLSDSRVVRVSVLDPTGTERLLAAGKLSTIERVDDEVARFNAEVTRLRPGAFPQVVEVVRGGARKTAGAFYRLADAYDPFFAIMLDPGTDVMPLVGAISSLTEPWRNGLPEDAREIGDLRRRLLPDDKAAALAAKYNLDWIAGFERKRVQTRWGSVHGDLHGGNILVARREQPILIDFGEVAPGPSSLDAITLELSLLFHPDYVSIVPDWPTPDHASHWCDLDRYATGAPCEAFIRACRRWANEAAAAERDMLATAYAYVFRQLKYDNTRKDVALALLQSVRIALEESYAE